jgi:hypothetical protein
MSYTGISLALLGLLLSFDYVPDRAELMVRKCRNTTQRDPVMFLDGLPATNEVFKTLAESDIQSVEVTCLNPIDSTRLASGSSAAGLPAIIAWSKRGPASALKPALTALMTAQKAHFARTGAYSRDAATLQLPTLPSELKLSLDATTDGWIARTWVDRRFSPSCAVYVGNVTVPATHTKDAIACRDG